MAWSGRRPLSGPEFTSVPFSISTNAASATLPPEMTSTMGRPYLRANRQSRSSWPGTAMIAPVP